MTVGYLVTVTRPGDEWQAVCPALCHHGAVIYGDTREDALTDIDIAIIMMLAEKELNGVSPPANEPVRDSVVLTLATEGEAE